MNTEQTSEKLSALLDDALDVREGLSLLEDMRTDRDLRAKYHRYQAVRSVLRAESSSLLDVDFSARVRAAIDEEPTVLSPRAVRHQFREKVATFALAASMADSGSGKGLVGPSQGTSMRAMGSKVSAAGRFFR